MNLSTYFLNLSKIFCILVGATLAFPTDSDPFLSIKITRPGSTIDSTVSKTQVNVRQVGKSVSLYDWRLKLKILYCFTDKSGWWTELERALPSTCASISSPASSKWGSTTCPAKCSCTISHSLKSVLFLILKSVVYTSNRN